MTGNRLVIAGVSSGSGKTTITLGLMTAFKKRGQIVQGFKCGPDYIDPSLHTAVTGRPSRNLDSWMFSDDLLKEVFIKGSEKADISLIEGVMGFYDGKSATSNKGSTAEISTKLQCPTILVVDCSKMARSAAAIVKGYQTLDPNVNIAGVVASKVGSANHYQLIKEAVEQECDLPMCGYLPYTPDIEMPERHLGLIPAIENGELDPLIERMGQAVEATINVDKLIQLSEQDPIDLKKTKSIFISKPKLPVTIAVAWDRAFNFYYSENLELFEAYGATLVYFSPLAGEKIPEEADGVYLGGGFPEFYAAELSVQTPMLQSFSEKIAEGMPVLAECGGFMFLSESIETVDGVIYQMVGAIKGKIKMGDKLARIGYREISGAADNFWLGEGEQARGHEFHYSMFHASEKQPPAYYTKGSFGEGEEGVITKNVIAGYTHIHFASCPKLVENFIGTCLENKR